MRLVAGPLDKLCKQCPGGLTKMIRLPHTSTWICPICSGLDYYTPTTETEGDNTEEEEEQEEKE